MAIVVNFFIVDIDIIVCSRSLFSFFVVADVVVVEMFALFVLMLIL